jgi:hypothetical protein
MRRVVAVLILSLALGCSSKSQPSSLAASPSISVSTEVATCSGRILVPYQVSEAHLKAGRDADSQAVYQKLISDYGPESLEFKAFNLLLNQTVDLQDASLDTLIDASIAACEGRLLTRPGRAAPPVTTYSPPSVPSGLPSPPDFATASCETIINTFAGALLQRTSETRAYLLEAYSGSAANGLQDSIDAFLADPRRNTDVPKAAAYACGTAAAG